MAWINFEDSMGYLPSNIKAPSLDDALAEVNSAFSSIQPSYPETPYSALPSGYPSVQTPEYDYGNVGLQTPSYDWVGNDETSAYTDADGNVWVDGVWYNANGEAWNDTLGSWQDPESYNTYFKDLYSGIMEHENLIENSPTMQEEYARQSRFNQPLPDYAWEHEQALRNTYDPGQIQQFQSDQARYTPLAEHEAAIEGAMPGLREEWVRDELIKSGMDEETISSMTLDQQIRAADTYRRFQEHLSAPSTGSMLPVIGALFAPFSLAQKYIGGPIAQLALENPQEALNFVLSPGAGTVDILGNAVKDPEKAWDSYKTAVEKNEEFLNNENIPWYLRSAYYTATDLLTYASAGIATASKTEAGRETLSNIPWAARQVLENGDLVTVSAFNLSSDYVVQSDWFQKLAAENEGLALLVMLGAPVVGGTAAAVGRYPVAHPIEAYKRLDQATGEALYNAPNPVLIATRIANSVADVAMSKVVAEYYPDLLSGDERIAIARGASQSSVITRAVAEEISDMWYGARLAAGFAVGHPGAAIDAVTAAVDKGLMLPARGIEIVADALTNITKDTSIQAIKQGVLAALTVPVTGVPAITGRIPRDLPIIEISPQNTIWKPVKEALALHKPTGRAWFHTTRNLDFQYPDPQQGVGQATGITQGPGIYLAGGHGRSARYGERQFSAQFTGNAVDLTARSLSTEPIDANGTVSWDDVAKESEARLRRLLEPGVYLRISVDPSTVLNGSPFVWEVYGRSATRPGKQDFTGYEYRHAITTSIENVLLRIMQDRPEKIDPAWGAKEEDVEALFGQFSKVITERAPSASTQKELAHKYALSIVNDILSSKGVDALFHTSPNHDGDVLVVLNGDKLKIGTEVKAESSMQLTSPTGLSPAKPETFHDYLRGFAERILVTGAMRSPYKMSDVFDGELFTKPDGLDLGVWLRKPNGKEVALPFRLSEKIDGWEIRRNGLAGHRWVAFTNMIHDDWKAAGGLNAPNNWPGKNGALDAIQKHADFWLSWEDEGESLSFKIFRDQTDPEDVTTAMHAMLGYSMNMGLKQAIIAIPSFAAGIASAPDDLTPEEKLLYGLGAMAMGQAGIAMLDKAIQKTHQAFTKMPSEKIGAIREQPRPFDKYGELLVGPLPVMVSGALGEMHPERALRGLEDFKAAVGVAADRALKFWEGDRHISLHWGDKQIRQVFQEAQRLRKVASSTAAIHREVTLAITKTLHVDKDGVARRITEDPANQQRIQMALGYPETGIASGRLTRAEVDAIESLRPVLGFQTVQDIAAKFDTWKKSGLLSKEDIAGIEELRSIMAPYQELKRSLTNVKSGDIRPDIEPGGFYLPRGEADKVGDEIEPRLRSSGFNKITAGKDSSQRTMKKPSMAEAIREGYEYKPLAEVIDSHIRWTMEKTIIDFIAKQILAATDEDGNQLAKSSYRVDPEIRDIYDAGRRELNKLISQVNRVERNLKLDTARKTEADRALTHVSTAMDKATGARDRLIEEKYKRMMTAGGPVRIKLPATPKNLQTAEGVERGLRYFDTAISRIEKRIEVLSGRKDVNTVQLTALKNELQAFKTNSLEFKVKWEQAKRDAYARPRGRDVLSEIQGLEGKDFPREYHNAVKRALEDFMDRPTGRIRGTFSSIDKAAEVINGTLRAVRATADVSFMGIQGLLSIGTDPESYFTAWLVATKSIFNDREALGRYIRDYDANAAPGFKTTDFAKDGLVIQGPNETEYSINAPLSFREHKLSNAPVIAQSNAAFTMFSDVLRINMYRNLLDQQVALGRDITDIRFRQDLASSVNRITGHADRRFGGALGSIAMFAPRFFESQLETVIKAAVDRGIEGEIARTALLKTAGLGVLFTFLVNEANGEETVFDPTDSNFMRMRNIAGVDVSLFGPWDSLLRGVVKALPVTGLRDGDIELKDWGRWIDDSSGLVRSKSSPIVSMAWDLFTGKNYFDEDVDVKDPGYWARALLPLSLSEAGREPLFKTLIGLSGTKAAPLTPIESALRKEWEDGTLFTNNQFVDKLPAKLSDVDPLTSRRLRFKYGEVDEELKKRYPPELVKKLDTIASTIAAADAGFRDDPAYTVARWKEVWATQMRDQALAYKEEFKDSPDVPNDPNNPRRWIEDWYKTFETATRKDGTIDSEYLASIQAPLIEKLKLIPWFDNKNNTQATAYEYIKEYGMEGKSEIRRKYLEAMQTLASAGYFDVSRHVGLTREQEQDYQSDRIQAQSAILLPETASKYPISAYKSTGDQLAHYMYDKLISEGVGKEEAALRAYYVKYVGQEANNPEYLKIKNDPALKAELLWLNDNSTWKGILNASSK